MTTLFLSSASALRSMIIREGKLINDVCSPAMRWDGTDKNWSDIILDVAYSADTSGKRLVIPSLKSSS